MVLGGACYLGIMEWPSGSQRPKESIPYGVLGGRGSCKSSHPADADHDAHLTREVMLAVVQ